MDKPVLEVTDLCVRYQCSPSPVFEGLSFCLWEGEILCLCGRSGAGKSTVVRAVLGALPDCHAIAQRGKVLYRGADLLCCGPSELRRLRWHEIALVPQHAMGAFNPVYPVRRALREMLLFQEPGLDARACRLREEELAQQAHLPVRALDCYPHELSGGQRQRAALALAMVYSPRLLILDEATTGLDLKLQADVLGTILQLKQQRQFSILFISHDAPLADAFCDRRVELL